MPTNFRVKPVWGERPTTPGNPRDRQHYAVHDGTRLIGENWVMTERQAEELREALIRAYQQGRSAELSFHNAIVGAAGGTKHSFSYPGLPGNENGR